MRNSITLLRTGSTKALFLAGLLCFLGASVRAQTPVEDLQNGVEIYNAMREYSDGLSPKSLTQDQITNVKNRMDKGMALLEKVILEGNAEQIRAARYFKSNFIYQYGFVLGMKGENAKAYDLYKGIDQEFSGYSASDFPIRYSFFDKNFVVKWENFAPTQAEYYTGMAEICYNLSKLDESVRFNRLAMAHPNTSSWLQYISVNKMLEVYSKRPGIFTEAEYYDFVLLSIKKYEALDTSSRSTVAEYNYPSFRRGVGILLDDAQKGNTYALAKCRDAAALAGQDVYYDKTLQLFELCYRNKVEADAGFHNGAEAYARKSFSSAPSKATSVGISATDALAQRLYTSDCNGFDSIIEKYNYWKQSAKAAVYVKKKEECLANVEKARKKEAKRLKRSNRSFNLYTGMYVLPLLKSSAHRDYGAAVNFVGKKFALEFSYLDIKRNKDNVFDLRAGGTSADQDNLPRWNGYYAHIQPKFIYKKNFYYGPLLGYAEKKFEPTVSNVTRDSDGTVSEAAFQPIAKQYIVMFNGGAMGLGRGLGFDMYWGIGVAYSQWELGGDVDTETYTIANPALENRKPDYFGPILRMGFTVGLNFGRGNLR